VSGDAVGHDPDPQFARGRQNLGFDETGGQRVLDFQRAHRMHTVRLTQLGGVGLRESQIADLALGDQVGDRAHGVFDRNRRVEPARLVQVDDVDSEALK
jgi:hypothetical protein